MSSSWVCVGCQTANNKSSARCTVCFRVKSVVSQPNKKGADERKKLYPVLRKKSLRNGNQILKQGPLQKKGNGMFAGWNTRYFILKQDGDFAYYGDKACSNWKGNINLQQVSQVVRKDRKNLVLHTAQRNWCLMSNNKSEMDHWHQLLLYLVTVERNKKKKQKQKPPASRPPSKPVQAVAAPHKEPPPPYNANNDIGAAQNKKQNANNNAVMYAEPVYHGQDELNIGGLQIPAFNPEFVSNKQQPQQAQPDVNGQQQIQQQDQMQSGDEGVSPAYFANDLNISETKSYETACLCIWRIAETVSYDDDDDDKKADDKKKKKKKGKKEEKADDEEEEEEKEQTLQILMGLRVSKKNKKKAELEIFSGDKTMTDYTPIDAAVRNLRVQTGHILDDFICDQIIDSLSTNADRHMFWSGDEFKCVTYFKNLDYDYELVNNFNTKYAKQAKNDNRYFEKLYWINWQDLYKYAILYSDPEPIVIGKKRQCTLNEMLCELLVHNDVASHFHAIINKRLNNNDDDDDDEDNDAAVDEQEDSEDENEQKVNGKPQADGDEDYNRQPNYLPDDDDDAMSDHVPNMQNASEAQKEFDPYDFASAPQMSVQSLVGHHDGNHPFAHNVALKQHKWQWFDGDSKFEDFESDCNQKIEHSFLLDPKSVFLVNAKDTKYKINLRDMTQTNTKTKNVRLIRRFSMESDMDFASVFASNGNVLPLNPEWSAHQEIQMQSQVLQKAKEKKMAQQTRFQYMDDSGEWQEYDKELALQISIAALSSFKYAFTNHKGEKCEIDFKVMEERNIDCNGQVRPIRRLEVD